jgi:predicted aspartyl protease
MTEHFDLREELVVVPATLYGPHRQLVAHLAVDTGASMSLVNAHLLHMLGYSVTEETEQIEITTGSGVEYVPLVKVKRIAALGKSRRGFVVACHTLPPSANVDGLLGLDFLKRRRLMIDFRKGLIGLD